MVRSGFAAAVMMLVASAAGAQDRAGAGAGMSALAGMMTTAATLGGELPLSRAFRLRFDTDGPVVAAPVALLDPHGHRRRLTSTADFYPMSDTGLHFSFGWVARPRLGRMAAASVHADLKERMGGMTQMQPLRAKEGLKRRMPLASVGWTAPLTDRAVLRLDAGAMMIGTNRVRSMQLAAAYPGEKIGGGSHAGAVARLTLIGSF